MLLSCPLVLALLGPQLQDLQNPVVDPAGNWLAFVDDDGPGKSELLAATLDPRGPTLVLSGAAQALTDIALHLPHRFVAGGRVVFLADRLVDQRFELWSIGADLVPLLLSGGGNVLRFETDPARSRVVFCEGSRLHARATDGASAALELGPDDALGVVALEVSPDGTRAAFVTKHSPLRHKLWIQPLDGSQVPTLLADGLLFSLFSGIEDEESIANLTFTPDGGHVLFGELTGPFLPQRYLSSVASDGSTPRLGLPPGSLAPEGRSVVAFGPELSVLETDVIDGSRQVRVGARIRRPVPGGPSSALLSFSEDGQYFVASSRWPDGTGSLGAAPRAGAPRFLPVADLPGSGHALAVGSSGVTLVYQLTPGPGARQLWRVPLDGSTPAELVGAITHWTSSTGSRATRVAGNELVFLGTLAGQPLEGLWRVTLDGSSAPRLLTAQPIDPLLVTHGFVVGTDRTDGTHNLWGLPLDGSFAPLRYD